MPTRKPYYDFAIPKGDRSPSITYTLRDEFGKVVPIGAGTVKFSMTPVGSTTAKVNGASATVVSAPNGQVSYAWGATDTDTEGEFYAEWELSSGGLKRTFPAGQYLIIYIRDDLA